MDQESSVGAQTSWPKGLTRVPFQAYQDPTLLDQEQRLVLKVPSGTICAWKLTSLIQETGALPLSAACRSSS